MVRNQYNVTPRRWRFDGRSEFYNKNLQTLFQNLGIIADITVPYTPQQNGRAERLNRTLMDKAQAMRFDACLPPSWWEFCVEHAAHLYQRTPSERINWSTPIECLHKVKPDVSNLKVFGCGAYVYLPQEKRTNSLAPKSELMVFIGFKIGTKGYRFMRSNNSIFIGHTAMFDETMFPRCPDNRNPGFTEIGQDQNDQTDPHGDVDPPSNGDDDNGDDGDNITPSHLTPKGSNDQKQGGSGTA